MVKNKIEFLSFSASAAVLALFLANGVVPTPNPVRPNEYIVERSLLTIDDWRSLMRHPDFMFLGFSFVFGTSGSTLTLPGDFSITNNTIFCIGAGGPGLVGNPVEFCCPNPPVCPGGSSCGGGCAGGGGTFVDGTGGLGGGAGACAEIFNYSLHAPGQGVPIQVGSGNTWFHSSFTCFALAGGTGSTSGPSQGGQTIGCVGTTKIAGGNGGFPDGTKGGVGGAAGGPTTFGSNPGAGAQTARALAEQHGLTGNQYGGGGGGGGGALASGGTGVAGAGGSGYQGLVAVQYVPIPGTVYFFTAAF